MNFLKIILVVDSIAILALISLLFVFNRRLKKEKQNIKIQSNLLPVTFPITTIRAYAVLPTYIDFQNEEAYEAAMEECREYIKKKIANELVEKHLKPKFATVKFSERNLQVEGKLEIVLIDD